jgi:hypothetical protein
MEKLHKNANLTNFKQLNYPYTIKIALIKRNQTEQHHFKKKSSAKRTYQIKSAFYFQISPPDGTQYAIISTERRSENEARNSNY